MIITIQPLKKGYAIMTCYKPLVYPKATLQDATRIAGFMSDTYFNDNHVRPTIKMLPIIHTPMATKKTYPAKKKAVVKKVVKKAVKKAGKK